MGRHALKVRKGIVGIEAAIILIAFVIISAAFAFMVINMGLFATQRSKDTIAQGLREASSPLQVDGNIFVRVMENNLSVNSTIIPLRAMGVKYVPVGKEETVVSLSVVYREGSSISYANIYYGVVDSDFDPTGKSFDELVKAAINELPGEGSLSFTLTNYTTGSQYQNDVVITLDSTNYNFTADTGTWRNMTITVEAPSTTASFNVALIDENGTQVATDTSENGIAKIVLYPSYWKNGTYTLEITEATTTTGAISETYNVTFEAYNDTTGAHVYVDSQDQGTSVPVSVTITRPLPAALLIVENSDGDEALDASEKGFLVILLGPDNKAEPRSLVTVEIRVEKSAPLTVEFMVPESLTADSWMLVAG